MYCFLNYYIAVLLGICVCDICGWKYSEHFTMRNMSVYMKRSLILVSNRNGCNQLCSTSHPSVCLAKTADVLRKQLVQIVSYVCIYNWPHNCMPLSMTLTLLEGQWTVKDLGSFSCSFLNWWGWVCGIDTVQTEYPDLLWYAIYLIKETNCCYTDCIQINKKLRGWQASRLFLDRFLSFYAELHILLLVWPWPSFTAKGLEKISISSLSISPGCFMEFGMLFGLVAQMNLILSLVSISQMWIIQVITILVLLIRAMWSW